MKDPQNREIMTRLYRLIEKYETTPHIQYTDEGQEYFSEVLKECMRIFSEFQNNEFAQELVFSLYSALEKRFQKVNTEPLKDREE